MRIRIFQAFASNNSGSYTLVGQFCSVADAEEAARILEDVCARESAWHESRAESPSPLEEFASTHALRPFKEDDPDNGWPDLDSGPRVVMAGTQVLVHVNFTVTMPRVLGEFLFSKGGRISLELIHSHDPLAAELEFWIPDARGDEEAQVRLQALRAKIEAILPPLTANPGEDRKPISPAWYDDEKWSLMTLAVVFDDLAAGVLAVRSLAEDAGVSVYLTVFEVHERDHDPFAPFRNRKARDTHGGRHRVVLWRAGPQRVEVLKALREALECTLEEACTWIDDLPKEVFVDVSEDAASTLAAKLRAAGADAEAILPITR
jgi:ribosomal protein L7/L12